MNDNSVETHLFINLAVIKRLTLDFNIHEKCKLLSSTFLWHFPQVEI